MPERRQRPIYAARFGDHDYPPSQAPHSPHPHTRPYAATRDTNLDETTSNVDYARAMSDNNTSSRRRRSRSDTSDEEESRTATRRREHDAYRRRMLKRRRTDTDATPVAYPPIRYGHFGQVEPGRLKVIMISCDGGEYTDPRNPHIYLGPHNVLKADKSVYCSARKHASIILRHADNTPFSMTQLSVVAPENGFTAPAREGTVYVAMTLEALKNHEPVQSPERLSLFEALRDPEITARMEENNSTSFASDESSDSEMNAHATLASDIDLGPEDVSSQEVLDYRTHRRQNLQRRREEHMRWRYRQLAHPEDTAQYGAPPSPRPATADLFPRRSYSRQLSNSNNDSDVAIAESHTIYTKLGRDKLIEAGQLPSEDPAVNFAHFRISDKSHKVTVKFNTPVSGRFVLVKLSATCHADNVDVQTIIATGFAGPRFFPAVQPR